MDKLLEKQERGSGHIIRAYDNLKRLGQANITLGVLETKIAVLDAKWSAFVEDHERLEEAATAADRKSEYFRDDVYSTTEDQYALNKGKFLDLVRQLKGATEPTAQPAHNAQQLPRISVPKFSGEFAEWPGYRDLFSSMVGNNSSISAVEKMHHLKMSLTGEPAALLASTAVTAENLPIAWKALTDRYENKRLLTKAQIAKIFALQPAKAESSVELKTLFDGTVNAVAALKNLGRPVDGYGDFLVHLTVSKLDKESRREWEAAMGATKVPPTFAELQTFLETRICTVQALESSDSPSATKPAGSGSQPKAEAKPGGQVKSHQATSTPSATKKCPLCQQEHYIAYCDEFRAKSVDERRAFALARRLCLNCLGRHCARDCRSQRLCQECQEKHHTTLHGAKDRGCSGSPADPRPGTSTGEPPQPASAAQDDEPSTSGVATHATQCLAASSSARVLLATAVVNAFTAGGEPVRVRALLDQGSEASFVSEALAQRLRLSRAAASVVVTGIGAGSALLSRGRVSVTLSSRLDPQFEIAVDALVLPRLTSYAPTRTVAATRWPHLEGLQLADPDLTSTLRIDVLLGADVFSHLLLPGVRKGPHDAPVAQNTRLGWILSGRVRPEERASSACASHQLSIDHALSLSLQRFWEQEEVTTSAPLTEEEEECERHFSATHARQADGRYVVRLPLKSALGGLGDSLPAASRMLSRMEHRFSRDASFARAYSDFLAEYEALGHMELVPRGAAEPALACYLPHHGVTRESSETTKLRVVFNGSQKTSLGFSLNDCLHVGPTLLPELFDVMLRWRKHAVVFSADMEKMFRQVLVHPADRDLQRILWRPGGASQRETYRLRTVTYGLACAPFLALRTIRQLALDEKGSFPLGSAALLTDVYVDDVLSGADDVASALVKQREITELLKAGGFALQKWTSSSSDVLAHLPKKLLAAGTSFSPGSESSFHVLGLSWRADDDCFVFRLKAHPAVAPLTKRRVLSNIAEMFDPLGWLAPVVVRAKIFMQSLWLLKLEWDEPLPDAESRDWLSFYSDLPAVTEIRIPRWLRLQSTSPHVELHGFADASERAYAAVVYACVSSPARSVTLVASKTKVAPVKQVSLPRLELCAAHLLVRLVKRLLDVLGLQCAVHLWSDSTVVLAWIQGHPVRWKTYVANRVSEIQRTLPHAAWRHVGTKDNPADCASRGLLASELRDRWPAPCAQRVTDPPEQRVLAHVAAGKADEPVELLSRYSGLSRLQHVVAWCRRFFANSRIRGDRRCEAREFSATLLSTELSAALSCLLRIEQARLFASELAALRSGSAVSKGSLIRLTPFLDGDGLLRVGGRLKHAVLDADERHPLIVPHDSPLAALLIDRAHRQTLHGGTQLTLATLRQRFWIVAGRPLVKTFVGRCIRCRRFRAATATQLMGNLPRERVTPSRPFYHSGVDYAGQVHLRTSKGRGHKSTKAYLAVFVCFATRAVHLEAVSDYSTDAFLAAYKRFVSRRGLCRTLSSDCGTNFVGADRELRLLFTAASSEGQRIATALANDGVEWKFNPPAAPHFGGLWEAAVKSVKHHLRRVIGETTLTFEEMATLLSQIEACLNSRPLGALTDDPDDVAALTPGHFLIGAPLSAVPEPSLVHLPVSRLSRWQLIQRMRDSLWARWAVEYLRHLQVRPKWHKPRPPLQVGDLVLVTSEICAPTKWPHARVTAVHPGGDGHVRVATVKTATSTFKRPVVKLCVLAKKEDIEG